MNKIPHFDIDRVKRGDSYFSQNSSLIECNESLNYIPKNYNASIESDLSGDLMAQMHQLRLKNAEQRAQITKAKREKLILEAKVQTQSKTLEMFQKEYEKQKQADLDQIYNLHEQNKHILSQNLVQSKESKEL